MSNADLDAILATPQIHTDDSGVHRDDSGNTYVAVEVDGETTYEPTNADTGRGPWPPPDEGFTAGRIQGIRDAALYIARVGRLPGANEQRLKMAGAVEFLQELADAVKAGDVIL